MTDESRRAALGDRVKKWRKIKGMTREELSGFAVLAVRTISLIESGVTDTKVSSIYRIADALHISPSVLIEERENEGDNRRQELWMLWQRMTPSSKEIVYATGKAMMERMEQIDQQSSAC